MSLTTAPIRSSFQSCFISEECYCAPWDLKIQEEKFKSLNEQHHISVSNTLLNPLNKSNQSIPLSFNHNNIKKPFRRTYSARKSSTKRSSTHRKLSPPVLPPFPPGGLIPSCQCGTNNNTGKFDPQTVCSGADTQLMSFETALVHFKHLNSSSKSQTPYEQPWDTLQTSLINNFRGRSLQKIPNTKQHCSSPTRSVISPCRHSNNATTIPIDRYFWYHNTMSRREAENVLESRPSGSFLVRQSESGGQNDYSLSIKTSNGCMHMRICYSDGFYILGECSRPFLSVSCMIKYFSQTFVPIRGAAHIKLGTPVLRWEIVFNKELL